MDSASPDLRVDTLQLEDVDVVSEEVTGCILKRRYLIGRQVDRGSFGRVYKVIDLQDQERPLVIKVCDDYKLFAKEIAAMHNIHRKCTPQATRADRPAGTSRTPEVVAYGMVMVCDGFEAGTQINKRDISERKLMSYLIMPRFGRNLETYFES